MANFVQNSPSFQVVKNSFCLRFSAFLICKQLLLNVFWWPSLAKSENILQNLSKPRHIFTQQRKQVAVTLSVYLFKKKDSMIPCVSCVILTVDHRWRQMMVKTKCSKRAARVSLMMFSPRTLWRPLWSIMTRPRPFVLFVLYNEQKGKNDVLASHGLTVGKVFPV